MFPKYRKGQHFVLLIATSTVLTFLRHTSQYKPICNLHLGYRASSGSYLSGRRTVYSNQAWFSISEYLKLFISLILDGTPPSKSNAKNKATHTFSNVFGQPLKLEGRHRFRAAPLFRKFFLWVLARIFPIWHDFSKSRDTMLANCQRAAGGVFSKFPDPPPPFLNFNGSSHWHSPGGNSRAISAPLWLLVTASWGTNCNTELLWK